jgi:hypothetical protein
MAYGTFPTPRKGAPRERWRDPVLVDMCMKFHAHRGDAKRRGIVFSLSFDEWRTLWLGSGKWDQRGWRRGQYVMSRPGDSGPYALGNVRVCLAEENRAERQRNYPLRGSRNGAFGKNYWAAQAPEAREARRAAISAAQLGRPKPRQLNPA